MGVCDDCEFLTTVIPKTGLQRGETLLHCKKKGRCLKAEEEFVDSLLTVKEKYIITVAEIL